MNQQFIVSDIQQSRVGDADYAAITLAPPAPTANAAPGVIPYGPVQTPSTIRLAGLTPADILGYALGDTVSVTVSKVGA